MGHFLFAIHEISIHALREEGDAFFLAIAVPPFLISIHALREEGDFCLGADAGRQVDFYPRPPRGGRQMDVALYAIESGFLSTPSARRATVSRPRRRSRGSISIHALREEGDRIGCADALGNGVFLSTPSARRATRRQHRAPGVPGISIHALREEGDLAPFFDAVDGTISIHALREEGDPLPGENRLGGCISIHALREEGDRVRCLRGSVRHGFLSTPSARRATS